MFSSEELKKILDARSFSDFKWGVERGEESLPVAKHGGSILLESSNFTANSAAQQGGAVYIRYLLSVVESLPVVAYVDSIFSENEA